MLELVLTRRDWARAAAIAFDRKVAKDDWQNETQAKYRDGLLHTAIIGALGEIAFSSLTGLPVDESIYEFGDKYDFKFGDLRIAVKTREYCKKDIDMILFPSEPKNADIFVLFQIKRRCNRINLLGSIRGSEIIENYRPEFKPYLQGRKISVPAYVMKDPRQLVRMIKDKQCQITK